MTAVTEETTELTVRKLTILVADASTDGTYAIRAEKTTSVTEVPMLLNILFAGLSVCAQFGVAGGFGHRRRYRTG